MDEKYSIVGYMSLNDYEEAEEEIDSLEALEDILHDTVYEMQTIVDADNDEVKVVVVLENATPDLIYSVRAALDALMSLDEDGDLSDHELSLDEEPEEHDMTESEKLTRAMEELEEASDEECEEALVAMFTDTDDPYAEWEDDEEEMAWWEYPDGEWEMRYIEHQRSMTLADNAEIQKGIEKYDKWEEGEKANRERKKMRTMVETQDDLGNARAAIDMIMYDRISAAYESGDLHKIHSRN